MPRWAIIRRVMIGAPGDTKDLVEVALRSIYGWNDARSQSLEMLEPVFWKKNTYPAFNPGGGQVETNTQILEDSDIVVGIFRHRLGTPTDGFASGTADEILTHVDSNRPAMVYFSNEPLPRDADLEEFKNLNAFRTQLQLKGLMGDFDDPHSFGRKLSDDLTKISTRYPLNSITKLSALQQQAVHAFEIARGEIGKFRFEQIKVDNEDVGVALRCMTFRPYPGSMSEPFDWWRDLNTFDFNFPDIDKSEIYRKMENITDSFKFVLRVPIEQREKYTTRLVRANVVVTGMNPDPEDAAFVRIWFLHPDGFIHPYAARPYLANHSLVDLSLL